MLPFFLTLISIMCYNTSMDYQNDTKYQWENRPEHTHRVRLHIEEYNLTDNIVSNKNAVFKNVLDKFKHTNIARWCIDNQVELKFTYDHDIRHWFHVAVIYCDLNETQYSDYILRFMYL